MQIPQDIFDLLAQLFQCCMLDELQTAEQRDHPEDAAAAAAAEEESA